MPSQDEINAQQSLLVTCRRTLVHYLEQQAKSYPYTPSAVMHGIHDARTAIQRSKETLRNWGIDVEDHPDDEHDLGIPERKVPPEARLRVRWLRKPHIYAVLGGGICLIVIVALLTVRWQRTRSGWPQVHVVGQIDVRAAISTSSNDQRIGRDCSGRRLTLGDTNNAGVLLPSGVPITVTFTIQNDGVYAVTIGRLVAAARGPYAWDLGWSAPPQDFPHHDDIVVEPMKQYVYTATQTFYKPGDYFIEPTLQNGSGQWGGISPYPRYCFVVVSQ